MACMTKHCRDNIICTGGEILLEKSYFAVGINEILASVGVPKGSFYHFFASKEDFGVAVIEHFARGHKECLKKVLSDADVKPADRLIGYFQGSLAEHEKNGARMICVIAKLASEVSTLSPAMARALSQGIDGWLEVIAACVREGQESGDVPARMDPDAMGAWMYDTWNGALARMQVTGDTAPLAATVERFRWLLGRES
jgi:TetR/AcrR family transcriptional repressor of nem operon